MLMFFYYHVGDYIRYGYYNTVYVLTDLINDCFDEVNKYEKYEDSLNEAYNEDKDLGWEKV
tara:strand:+ start:905 stop:1087 length:183 start_codon:yes stop_codon:yes gene_type:complete